jgi:diguanylate cyclase (GGDEF)-like protein
VIVALQAPGYRFFDDEQARLDAYAALAGAAVEAAAEREATGALLGLATDLAAARTVQEAVDRALEVVVALTGASEAAVAIDGAAPDAPRVVASHGVGAGVDELLRPARDPGSDPMPDHDVALLATDELPPSRLRTILTTAGANGLALARVRWREDMLGWVATAWTGPAPSGLDPALAARLTGVAGLLAPAVVTAHALESSTHRALHDALTELPNRLLLADRFALAAARARRHRAAIGVVLVDLDGFKSLNDRYGHHAGDLALVEVADRLRTVVRDADTAARLGGDEFVVLTETVPGGTDVAALARRLERALEPPIDADGTEVALTASAGAAVVEPDVDLDEALARADARMFERKRERRRGAARPSPRGVPDSGPPTR